MDNKYIQEFRENCYNTVTNNFFEKTNTSIVSNMKQIEDKFILMFEELFEEVCQFQENIPIEVGCIQVSLMYTSIYENNPKIRIEVYSSQGIFEESIYNTEIQADWLFVYWKEYETNLNEGIKKHHLERYIRKAAVKKLMAESIGMLIYLYVINIKYLFAYVNEWKSFESILKSEGFYISAGGYLDWQKVLYASVSEVDIFFNTASVPLYFQVQNDKVFKNKQFNHLNLQNSRFNRDTFDNCSFEQVDLSDCDFNQCTFQNVRFNHCKLYGMLLIDCELKGVTIEQSEWSYVLKPDEKLRDVYRNGQIIDSKINKMQMINSNLSYCKIVNSKSNEVFVDQESVTVASDFDMFKGVQDEILSIKPE